MRKLPCGGGSINKPGNGYTLLATSTGLTSITSSPFSIAAGPAPTVSSPSGTSPFSISTNNVPVTITGTNFVSGAIVTVANGTAATGAGKCTNGATTFVSSTTLSVLVTASNGTGSKGFCDFTVTNPDGGSVTVISGLKNV